MATFKDNQDREWVLRLDAPTIRMVRNELDGLNLADLEGKTYEKLVADPVLLVDTLWLLCKDQAKAAGIDDLSFASRIVGDAIERASDAMLESIADFFPTKKREILHALAKQQREVRELGLQAALEKITDPTLRKRLLATMEARMDADLQSLLTQLSSATSSQVSSE